MLKKDEIETFFNADIKKHADTYEHFKQRLLNDLHFSEKFVAKFDAKKKIDFDTFYDILDKSANIKGISTSHNIARWELNFVLADSEAETKTPTTQSDGGSTRIRRRRQQSIGNPQAQNPVDVTTDEKKLQFVYDVNPGLKEAEDRIIQAGARYDIIRNKICTDKNKSENKDLAAKCVDYTSASNTAYMLDDAGKQNGFTDWYEEYKNGKTKALQELRPSIPANKVNHYKRAVQNHVNPPYVDYFNLIAGALGDAEEKHFPNGEVDRELNKINRASEKGVYRRKVLSLPLESENEPTPLFP